VKPVVHRFAVVSSTQDEARRLLDARCAGVGHAIVAERQTAGRGRFGRAWVSPAGGLYATFILEAIPIPAVRAGLAVVDALKRLGLSATLKWPNDVLVDGKKLAGILVETAGGCLLIGVGVNLAEIPLPAATAASAHGVSIGRDALLFGIWEALRPRRSIQETMDTYRRVCETIGRPVRVALEGVSIEGVAEDVDEAGRLVVSTSAGPRSVSSGECLHLDTRGDRV
jgi:BirA family biotin operon repressor/biotin-[acetyl-CoA-carboxylase] ligase